MTSQFSTYVITEPCVGVKDATYLEVCPVDCIESADDENQYFVDPTICIACEQCKLVCPVEAIFLTWKCPATSKVISPRMPIFIVKPRENQCPCP